MPINYQEVYARIQEIGQGARERKKTLDERRQKARDLLSAYASDLDVLRAKVDAAKGVDANIRCAYPLSEALDSSHPCPGEAASVTLLAADGSQINPDRHAAIQFCLINVGAIQMQLGSGEVPEITTRSELFYGNELEEKKLTSDGSIALQRDLNERIVVDELTKGLSGSVISLTDGTIEIWGAKDIEDAKSYEQSVQSYLTILSRLQSRGVTTAGYVDKPFANLVVRLLEIATATSEDLKKLNDFHPLQGVSDLWLFGVQNDDFHLLRPGERSAVFHLQSGSEKYYKGALSLYFFYLNVSDNEKYPQLARVEIPEWVVRDHEKLELLHAVLLNQCRIMGSRPYPYLLNRAHEIAVVKFEEKKQIEQLLTLEIGRHGEKTGNPSNKQIGKDSIASGRKRHGK